jgi:gamma-glutamylputrescine oxidase
LPGPHTDSYYAASALAAPEHAPLREAVDADVCVVGAGITGCSTALHLAERGYRVVVVERQRIGWGASGRSGGQIITGYACDMDRLERQIGLEDARRLWSMSLEAMALVRSRIQRHGIDCDLEWGHLHAAIKPRQVSELEAWVEQLQTRYGYDQLELLYGDDVRRVIDSDRYIAGMLDHGSGHLHPLNYTLGIARAAAQQGVRFHEGTPATRIATGARATVSTPEGSVTCDHVVLCGNAYLGDLQPELRRKVMPVGTYIIATEPLGEARARRIMPANAAVADVNFVLDYFRCSADHRLLYGGRVSYSTLTPSNLRAAMRPRMLKVFPGLDGTRIDFAWGGFVAITLNRAPHFGRLGKHVYFAQGFSGHGMALTGFAGALMAEAIAGTAERFDLFGRIRHAPFPGGTLLRTPALVLAMLYYRLRDLL